MTGARVLAVGLILVASGAQAASAQRAPTSEWEPGGRGRPYVGSLIGPGALVGLAITTTVDQLREDPAEWGDGAGGLGRRAASNAGRMVIQESVRHGLAAVMDRSTVYAPCACRGGGARAVHAFVEVITDRDRDGDRTISIPRFAGVYAGALAERTWRPGRSAAEVALAGASGIVFAGVGNLWRELVRWP